MSASTPNTRNQARSRNRTLALAGGAVAAASLAYAAYQWYRSSSASGPSGPSLPRSGGLAGSGDGTAQRKANLQASKSAPKLASRPTLSLSLPPHFPRTSEGLSLLADLLQELSEHYLIHLIVPTLQSPQGPPDMQLNRPPGFDEDQETDITLDPSAASLARALAHVPHFDKRRILEYSKPEGRQAVARALACDAHVQMLLSGPAAGGDDTDQAEKEITGLGQLQKSCGLVVVLSLPMTTAAAGKAHGQKVVESLSGNPGFRVYDLAGSTDERAAWGEGAAHLVELRSGWR